MVNEKYRTPQNNVWKNSHADFLKPTYKVWNINLRDAFKMINYRVDPKSLRFLQDILSATVNLFKSHLLE